MESSEEEYSSEEEETPPRLPKQKKVERRQPAWQPDGRQSKKKTFAVGKEYRPGMSWDHTWPPKTMQAWNNAKRKFHATGTKEAVKDKVNGLRSALKKAKEKSNKKKIGMFTPAFAK